MRDYIYYDGYTVRSADVVSYRFDDSAEEKMKEKKQKKTISSRTRAPLSSLFFSLFLFAHRVILDFIFSL
jgi:hypothetical protein